MKYKSLLFSIIITIGILAVPFRAAYSLEQTPEDFVREFYIWYSKSLEKDDLPELDDTIYKYVYPCTVNKLRVEFKMGAKDYNYFITGNDNWPELFDYITVGKAVKVSDEVSIVPLGFGETKERSVPRLVVFVQREKDALHIIKVERTDTLY